MILINKKVVVIWIWKHVKLSCHFPHFRIELEAFLTYDTVLLLLKTAVAALGAKTEG